MKSIVAVLLLLSSGALSAQEKQLASLCGLNFADKLPEELFHEPTLIKRFGKGHVGPSPYLPTHEYRLNGRGYLMLRFIENDNWLVGAVLSSDASSKDVPPLLKRTCTTAEGIGLGDPQSKVLAAYGKGLSTDTGVSYRYDDINMEALVTFKNGLVSAIELNSLVP